MKLGFGGIYQVACRFELVFCKHPSVSTLSRFAKESKKGSESKGRNSLRKDAKGKRKEDFLCYTG